MALGHLEGQLTAVSDDYTLAISAHALSLAASPAVDGLLARLENHAIVKGIPLSKLLNVNVVYCAV